MVLQYSGFQQAVWWWLLAAVAALFGAQFTDRNFYLNIKKPRLAPPPWAFGVAWTILYALQAQASYFVQRELEDFGWQCWIYLAFLIVSTLWVPLFFRMRLMVVSLLTIIISFALSVVVTVSYGTVYTASGLFMACTSAWILFATYLNWSIYVLNPRDTLKKDFKDDCDVLACKRVPDDRGEDDVYEEVPVRGDGDADQRFFERGVYSTENLEDR